MCDKNTWLDNKIFHVIVILLFDICVLDTGYVMHVDGKQDSGMFQTATLEYSVDKLAALGCQIRYQKPLFQQDFLKGRWYS